MKALKTLRGTVKGHMFPLFFANPNFPRNGPGLSLVLPCFPTPVLGSRKSEFNRGYSAIRAIAQLRSETTCKRLADVNLFERFSRKSD